CCTLRSNRRTRAGATRHVRCSKTAFRQLTWLGPTAPAANCCCCRRRA
ncbi:MAG: hypothetical protein AVDCRST_MAG64-1438, partial [uncultured Phycisphaerae bacterium]